MGQLFTTTGTPTGRSGARRLCERHPPAGGGYVVGKAKSLAQKYGPRLEPTARALLVSELKASPVHSVQCAAKWIED